MLPPSFGFKDTRYSVVINPGMTDERILDAGLTFDRAFAVKAKLAKEDPASAFDVMRITEDGFLSTEF